MISKGYAPTKAKASKGYDASESMPPSFSLDDSDLKELKSWKVGKTYDLAMTVKLVGQRNDSMDSNTHGTFEIIDVQPNDAEESDDGN